MFINISNHPSSSWKKDQLSAAKVYGKIYDISFPIIPPEMDTSGMKYMLREYIQRVDDIVNGQVDSTVIHVMGETVFTFMLVTALLQRNYRVVASTTERIVCYEGEVKQTLFKFVRFRDYALI